jgi:hypothetical protein
MALLCKVHYTLGNETSKTNSTYVEMVESFLKSWSKGQRYPFSHEHDWTLNRLASNPLQGDNTSGACGGEDIWSLWTH